MGNGLCGYIKQGTWAHFTLGKGGNLWQKGDTCRKGKHKTAEL